jgi:hypothetical protein
MNYLKKFMGFKIVRNNTVIRNSTEVVEEQVEIQRHEHPAFVLPSICFRIFSCHSHLTGRFLT